MWNHLISNLQNFIVVLHHLFHHRHYALTTISRWLSHELIVCLARWLLILLWSGTGRMAWSLLYNLVSDLRFGWFGFLYYNWRLDRFCLRLWLLNDFRRVILLWLILRLIFLFIILILRIVHIQFIMLKVVIIRLFKFDWLCSVPVLIGTCHNNLYVAVWSFFRLYHFLLLNSLNLFSYPFLEPGN